MPPSDVPDHEQLVDALRDLEALATLGDRHLRRLSWVVEQEPFAAEQVVYEEDSEGTDFHVVASGEVEARRKTPFGEQRVATLGRGDLVGEISLLDGGPRSSGVVCTRAGVLLRFDAGGVARLAGADPELEVALLRVFCRSLAAKIRQANQVMSEIMAPGQSEERKGAGARGEVSRLDVETARRLLRAHGMVSSGLEALRSFVAAQRFSAGDPIFVEGQAGDTLYIVAEGQVRISRRIPGLGEEAIAILKTGEVFGEMAWIDSSPRSADAVAHVGGCTVLAISRQLLDDTVASPGPDPAQFLKTLCQVLCRRLRTMNDQLVAYRTIAWF